MTHECPDSHFSSHAYSEAYFYSVGSILSTFAEMGSSITVTCM